MRKLSHIEMLEIATVVVLAVYFYLVISRWGVSWDNISAYFNTLTMAGKSSYYEILREPLAQLILLPGVLLGASLYQDIYFAQVLLAIFFLFSMRMLSESLGLKNISAYLVALSAVVIVFMFTLNITDIFGMSSAILAFAFYFKKDYTKSSIVFGLAFLAKFTNLIFLPCLPFMFKGKWRILSLAIVLAVNLPWLAANYYIYHNPFYGFELSNQVFAGQHMFDYQSLVLQLDSFLALEMPYIILVLAICYFVIFRKQAFTQLFSPINRIDICVLAFTLFEFIYVESAQNYAPWLGYPLYIATTIIAIKIISNVKMRLDETMAINLTFFGLAILTIAVLIYHSITPYNQKVDWQDHFSKNAAYQASINRSFSEGCGTIYSNAWPYLMVYDPKVLTSIGITAGIGSCEITFNSAYGGIPLNISGLSYRPVYSSMNYTLLKSG